MKTPSEIVQLMLDDDRFSRWLGIETIELSKGHCTLKMTVSSTMLNGFSIAHGGITYSLADSALAFASNAYGNHTVSIDTSINHLQKVYDGDTLYATCSEINRSRRIGLYHVNIENQHKTLVAQFKGTVAISEKVW